jgi:NaMN:DMB phosphoribosyltransferase
MQPAAAGLALGALQQAPVVLAGGTQMAAVLALMAAIVRRESGSLDPRRLAVATTRWVATDPSADLAGLARQLGGIPFLAADLDFGGSRHAALRHYERFLVKEGVGAGGAALAAMLTTGIDRQQLLIEIEGVYDQLAH